MSNLPHTQPSVWRTDSTIKTFQVITINTNTRSHHNTHTQISKSNFGSRAEHKSNKSMQYVPWTRCYSISQSLPILIIFYRILKHNALLTAAAWDTHPIGPLSPRVRIQIGNLHLTARSSSEHSRPSRSATARLCPSAGPLASSAQKALVNISAARSR